jgi:hypothetical protein
VQYLQTAEQKKWNTFTFEDHLQSIKNTFPMAEKMTCVSFTKMNRLMALEKYSLFVLHHTEQAPALKAWEKKILYLDESWI